MLRALPRGLAMLVLLSLCVPATGAAQDEGFYANFRNVDPFTIGWEHISPSPATWTVVADPAGLHGYSLSGTGFSSSAHGVLGHALGFSSPINLGDAGLWSWGTAFYIPGDTEYSLMLELGKSDAEDVLSFYVIDKAGTADDKLMFIGVDRENAGNNVDVVFPFPPLVTQHWYHIKLEQTDSGPVMIYITDMETWSLVFQDSVPLTGAGYSGMTYIGVGVETTNAHYFDEIFCEFYLPPVATEPATWGRVKTLYD